MHDVFPSFPPYRLSWDQFTYWEILRAWSFWKVLPSFGQSPLVIDIHINEKEYALSTMTTWRVMHFGKLALNYLLLITAGTLVFLMEWFLFKYIMPYAICCSRLFELSSIWFWVTKRRGEHTDGLSHKEVWWHVITLGLFFFSPS